MFPYRPRGRSSIIVPAGGPNSQAWAEFGDALATIQHKEEEVCQSCSCCFAAALFGCDKHSRVHLASILNIQEQHCLMAWYELAEFGEALVTFQHTTEEVRLSYSCCFVAALAVIVQRSACRQHDRHLVTSSRWDDARWQSHGSRICA